MESWDQVILTKMLLLINLKYSNVGAAKVVLRYQHKQVNAKEIKSISS